MKAPEHRALALVVLLELPAGSRVFLFRHFGAFLAAGGFGLGGLPGVLLFWVVPNK